MEFGPSNSGILCPYCNEREVGSDDHIFLEAIGGRRTIRACKPCNDLFGHSFEGSAVATFFHPLMIQLRGVGVSVIDTGIKWKRAFVDDYGMVYNAVPEKDGYKFESTNVVVNRDKANPRTFLPVLGDDRVGRRQMKQFLDPSKFRLVSTEKRLVNVPQELKLDWGFSPDLRLTALKMAFAVGAIAFPDEVANFVEARKELTRPDLNVMPTSVAADLRDHAGLDSLRDALCLVIYAEQGDDCIHGFVQLFGAVQFWVRLAAQVSGRRTDALIAKLDPVTGAESFGSLPPLNLPPFREGMVDGLAPMRKLNAGAAHRGARTAEMLKVNEIRVDGVPLKAPPRPYWMSSWTGYVPNKRT